MAAHASETISAKVANFKNAVTTRKTMTEHEHLSRVARYQEADRTLAATQQGEQRELMLQAFAARENEAVLAKVKTWSTNDFESVKTLGQGAFGIVHLVRKKGGEEYYALKQMKKSHYKRKNTLQRAFAERNILAESSNMWFVELYATFQDAEHIFMVMEFLQGGDLIYHLMKKNRFSLNETRFYMAELLEALSCVHRCGFVHRDVKPDNIVLTKEGHLKLLDFGLCKHGGGRDEQACVAASMGVGVNIKALNKNGQVLAEFQVDPDTETIWSTKNRIAAACGIPPAKQKIQIENNVLDQDVAKLADCGVAGPGPVTLTVLEVKLALPGARRQHMKSNIGTPQYMAPEVWDSSAGYGPEADLWSVGIITFECLVGHVPLHAGDKEGQEMVEIILQKVCDFERFLPMQLRRGKDKGYLTPTSQGFLSKVLVRKERRATITQCREDPFFFCVDFAKLHLQQPPIIPEVKGPSDTSYFDNFEEATLPSVCNAKKDASMDFAHYEFDRKAQDLHKPDLNLAELVTAAQPLWQ